MTRRRKPKLDDEWQRMQRRAAVSPIGLKRKRERELQNFTTQLLINGLKEARGK